jgi:hypothetical protein
LTGCHTGHILESQASGNYGRHNVREIAKATGDITTVTLIQDRGSYIVRRFNALRNTASDNRFLSPALALGLFNDYAGTYAGAAPVLSIET